MSCPLYSTCPVIFTPGTRSFMRFRVFRNVDLPQPEGPIRAVMELGRTSIVTWCSAWVGPYHRFRLLTEVTGVMRLASF